MPLRWPQEIQNDELRQDLHISERAQGTPPWSSILLQAEKSFFAKQSHLFPAAIARAKA
jgi:hypothetical protein